MKFEVKTQNDDLWKSSFSVLLSIALFSFIVVLSNISIKLGAISRHYEIQYFCNLLTIEKSDNFKVAAIAIAAIKCPQHIME